MKIVDYIPVILGGLYAITLISTTIFSIIGNVIQQKTMGMSPTSLIRYKIYMVFSPLYILTLYIGMIIFLPAIYNNIFFVFCTSIYLIIVITMQAYLILEPFYNLEKFKQHIIKKQIKLFNKKYGKMPKNILEKELIKELNKLSEYNNAGSYFDINDVKFIWKKYLEFYIDKTNELSVTFKKTLVQVGFSIFGDDLINVSPTDSITKYELIETIISRNLDKYNREMFIYAFDKLYELYDYYKKNKGGFEEYNRLFIKFMELVLLSSKYMNLLLEIILDDKWNIKDVEYISLFFRNVLIMLKDKDLTKIILNEILYEKVLYFMECYKDNGKFDSRYGEEYDDFIKSCFVLINKEENND